MIGSLGLALTLSVSISLLSPAAAAPPPPPTAEEQAAFQAWILEFKGQARATGISDETLESAFSGVTLNPRVLKADAYQPEFSKPIWGYLDSAASETRVSSAKKAYTAQKPLFDEVSEKYKVQSRYVVAIWGLETSFGNITGDYNVIEALATLAYKGRRTKFGRTQLMAALEIIQSGDKTADQMTGSWAGAMGHGQFIPTTYLSYAIDYDKDGRRDIWDNHGDVFASISNYLSRSGWVPGQEWGREVVLPEDFDYALADRRKRLSLSDWREKGVTLVSGDPLPDLERPASIIVPAGHKGPAFLILNNFRAILRYNNSTAYALAISLIADQSAGGPGVTKPWPRNMKPLARDDRMELQQLLKDKGYDPGGVDGIIGGNTRTAIRRFQSDKGLVADGFASGDLLDVLRGKAVAETPEPEEEPVPEAATDPVQETEPVSVPAEPKTQETQTEPQTEE